MDYGCVLCDRTFSSNEAWEQHQRDSPRHKNSFPCKTCNCSFGSKDALKQHQRDSPKHQKTSGNTEAPEQQQRNLPTFPCNTYDCYFDSAKALKSHMGNCQVHQEPFEDHPHASSDRRRDEPALSTAPIPPTKPPKKAKAPKKSRNPIPQPPTQETREFFTFPALHADIAEAVFPDIISTWFRDNDNFDYSNDEWLTHVMGKFTCNNNVCKTQRWASKKVPLEIQGYDGNGYHAVVFNQRCKSCEGLGTFVLDKESYVERVAYRLKKWAGVRMVPPDYNPKEGAPHERAFCEGCKRGKCRDGDDLEFF
ncbi:hypothetical protein CC86DRAFT_348664 [Ophiobolus disseminans]|uniref:C2H2-type domain-containing protein n=1 Tax=Ophiobolus disseminans TaxID=1469910 RepID=A0A6A7A3C2_9PLEO|nr:hypothetical protein CC86DRAFT_348664 [Ophiobolus disseminans]